MSLPLSNPAFAAEERMMSIIHVQGENVATGISVKVSSYRQQHNNNDNNTTITTTTQQ